MNMNSGKGVLRVLALSCAWLPPAWAAEADLRGRISEMERELARLKEEIPMQKPQEASRKETVMTDTSDREFHVERGAAFSLSNVSGEIRIEAWDKPAIGVRAEKRGKGAERIEIRIHHDAHDLRIETRCPRESGWNWSRENPRVDYAVRLPRRLLERISLVSVSGDIILAQVDAREIRISTVSGDIRAERCQGELSLETVSGDASAQVETDRLKATTVSGDFRLALTPTGDKRWELAANSVSGDVELLLPRGSGARYSFASMSGNARCRLSTTDARRARGRWEGTVGDGRGQIQARSMSGDLVLSEQ